MADLERMHGPGVACSASLRLQPPTWNPLNSQDELQTLHEGCLSSLGQARGNGAGGVLRSGGQRWFSEADRNCVNLIGLPPIPSR
jgi:hypothetical protein